MLNLVRIKDHKNKWPIILSFTIASLYTPSKLLSQNIDTIKSKPPVWYKTTAIKTLAAPSVLIVYGISTKGYNGLFYSSVDARRDIQNASGGFHTKVDNYLTVAPAVAVYALNFAGVKGKHNFIDRTLLYGVSLGLNELITLGLKTTTHVLRPDSTTYNSFPSGHTSTVFVAAEFMHQEYKDKSVWYSIAGYTIATGTGILRMVNNRHWMSDVFVGAGIGILTTKATYLIYPVIQKKIFKGRKMSKAIVPFYYNKTFGISMIYVLK